MGLRGLGGQVPTESEFPLRVVGDPRLHVPRRVGVAGRLRNVRPPMRVVAIVAAIRDGSWPGRVVEIWLHPVGRRCLCAMLTLCAVAPPLGAGAHRLARVRDEGGHEAADKQTT